MGMMERSQRKNKAAIDAIVRRLVPADDRSVTCPACEVGWNRLTPDGVCVDCADTENV